MGIETDTKYDGSESSFMSAILTIEELAKVDPSISVICDVQVPSFFCRSCFCLFMLPACQLDYVEVKTEY